MRLLIWYFADRAHGYGHKYRCLALGATARKMGHEVFYATNDNCCDNFWTQSTLDMRGLEIALNSVRPDWLIIDLEERVPLWAIDMAKRLSVYTCNINAPGKASTINALQEQVPVDCSWVQDEPERVILRESILSLQRANHRRLSYADIWFVFGGAADPLGLLPAFADSVADPAWLVYTNVTPEFPPNMYRRDEHQFIKTQDDEILPYMQKCDKACVHTGIIAWELAYLGVPMFLLSRSEGHLLHAQRLQSMGLARAYPYVGLPENNAELAAWLRSSFIPRYGHRPDGKGAERLLAALQ